MFRRISSALPVLLLFCCAGCPRAEDPGGNSPGNKSPRIQAASPVDTPSTPIVPDPEPELFAADPQEMIETSKWGRVPPHVINVILAEGKAEADAEAVADQLGGEIVGRLVSRRLYQVRISAQTEQELAASLDAARSHTAVIGVFPDQQIDNFRCHNVLDDPVYAGPNAGAFEIIHLADAWEMVSGAAALDIELKPVKIGVVDSPINTHSEAVEFGAINLITPSPSDRMEHAWRDAAGKRRDGGFTHGSQVTSVLAADPDNGGLTGVAGLLKQKLSLIHKTHRNGRGTMTHPRALYSVEQVIDRGGRIINMSWGTENPHTDVLTEYTRFFGEHPNVLFVAAAGKTPITLNGTNLAPGGLVLPNLITVGSINNSRQWDNVSARPGTGGELTIVAPGENAVRVVSPGGTVIANRGGTSMATPQVTAAAAIMLALDPTLSAAQVKLLLVDASEPAFTLDAFRELFKDETPPPTDAKLRRALDRLPKNVLRVDRAVLKVVNRLRQRSGRPLIARDDLMKFCALQVRSDGRHPSYDVKVTLEKVAPAGTEVALQMSGKGAVDSPNQHFDADGQSRSWKAQLGASRAKVLARRLDTGGKQTLELKQSGVRLFVEMPGTVGVYVYKKGPFGGYAYAWPGSRRPAGAYKQPEWEQPYLVVVEMGPYTQYVYPRNVKGLVGDGVVNLGTDRFYFDNPLGIDLPDKMTLSAVMPDGTTFSEKIKVEFRSGAAQPDWAAKYPVDLAKARQTYQAALGSSKTGISKLDEMARAATMLMRMLRDPDEAKKIANRVRHEIVTVRSGGINSAVLAQRLPQWEGNADNGQAACLYQARDVQGYLRFVDSLETAGKAHLGHYLAGMLLAVRFGNDTDDAEFLWDKARALLKKPAKPSHGWGLYGHPGSGPGRVFKSDADKRLPLPKRTIAAP